MLKPKPNRSDFPGDIYVKPNFMTHEQLDEILKASQRLAIPAIEKNIFSVGGRGHYENPISDILVFFLDIHENHGFGDLVLRSINEAAGLSMNDISLIAPPQREVYTDDGKKIDILVEGDDYVTMIENKIRHWAANPFDSYEAYLNQHHRGKRQNRILLSVRKETPPSGWVSLSYKTLLTRIRENFGEHIFKNPYSKWIILFREFLLNIEQECEADPMTNDRFEFICKNYGAINDLKKMADDYIKEIQKKALDKIRRVTDVDESDATTKPEDWKDDGIAIRLRRKQWGDKSNIALVVKQDGQFRVRFYVYDVQDSNEPELRKKLNNGKYSKLWTERSTIRCFGDFDSPDLNVILQEIHEVAERLNSYYYGNFSSSGFSTQSALEA